MSEDTYFQSINHPPTPAFSHPLRCLHFKSSQQTYSHQHSLPSQKGSQMRPRVGAARGVWCALGCMTAVFVLVNVYVAQLTLSTRRRHERPLIPGMLLQTPRNPVVVSKDGPLALQQQPLIQPKPDGKESVVERLQEATIPVNATLRARLPTWEQVQQVVGDHPILWTDRCAEFRQRVPAVRRMLGAAGMFSTGTNLVTTLLKQNCQIPERVAYYGVNATKEAHVCEVIMMYLMCG